MSWVGHEPPQNLERFGLYWVKGEELWDGSGYEWKLREHFNWTTLIRAHTRALQEMLVWGKADIKAILVEESYTP